MSCRTRLHGALVFAALLASAAGCSNGNTLSPSGVGTPQSLRIEGPSALVVGQSTQLRAVVRNSDGSESDVTAKVIWSAFDSGVVGLSPGGLVTGQNPGRCGIVARLDQISSEMAIAVVEASPGGGKGDLAIQSADGGSPLGVGKSRQLTLFVRDSDGTERDVTDQAAWSSADPGVATVSRGRVEGTGPGTTTVTATFGDRSAQTPITVADDGSGDGGGAADGGEGQAIRSISVDGNTSVSKGGHSQLSATAHMTDGTTRDVTEQAVWSSADRQIATVSAGLVTGTGVGTTTITAAFEGQRDQAIVEVSDAAGPTPMRLTVTGAVDLCPVAQGATAQLVATAHFPDGSSGDVTARAQWHVADPAIASVDSTGLVTALASGLAPVTATHRGVTATTNLAICLNLGRFGDAQGQAGFGATAR